MYFALEWVNNLAMIFTGIFKIFSLNLRCTEKWYSCATQDFYILKFYLLDKDKYLTYIIHKNF